MLLPETKGNTSFSLAAPLMQLAVDSTSLGAYKTCPRFYWYSILWGFETKALKVDLVFGLWVHGGVERYHHAKAKGASHDDALDAALAWVLVQTWNKDLSRPWASGDSYKNRLTLVRTLVWYLDQYGPSDPLETVILANGKPAVELSFAFNSGYRTQLGEMVQYCGHLDRLASMNNQYYIPDIKTTKYDMTPRYWQQHNPSNQFGMYTLAGQINFQFKVAGLIVDGVQVLVGSSRFQRQLISKDEATIDEWYRGSLDWVRRMEESAIEGEVHGELAYPMNDTSCSKYGGCPMQSICSRSPGSRQQWLETEFRRRVWDPLQRRGDI